ncbi:tRNA (5-aminomethyl-2-thiouridylate) methyltransferase [Luminiphilus syltensis NOR5-1B]|uniref:tRNA 5-methylaminomethyl-2-thiouridine biosynthesis bifunctional protein MnmC n=1 Tax=Luminiphilus syltensis NOR5-1B TaxID=565045 RepID=B8KXL4_9GAMM|nr:bifunctional tRNA (5-methylaminomethyl-2-thiouridine)(34)-methyltransferase MnmD/FAD-dependent 5-carboxymethylaminomethyl-2-thiouridine(34) oxidoreductase MnmC [Luminiphilus syltensis]EED36940.1 tRNA (5-aminomethyl-2-thiouridylate) methyltransferase [Luminiphilus syltensis NOR5-1B]
MINRQNKPWEQPEKPAIDVSANGLSSTRFDDVYFSARDPIGESRYTFLEGNALESRFRGLSSDERFTIIESGFGTGLNFLLTQELWQRCAPKGARLHYIGIDAYPLDATQINTISANHPSLTKAWQTLIERWPPAVSGCHRRRWAGEQVTLDLWWDDAREVLADTASHCRQWVNAWFLDGFAPSKNPDMWHEGLYPLMAQQSQPGATVATFTAAGAVRRGLTAAGFEVSKAPGFGRKREALRAVIKQARPMRAVLTPWDAAEPSPEVDRTLVLGAGLAGAWIARTLAERGVHVSVLERGEIAAGGSSNLQGLTYTRLSRRYGELSDFTLAAYAFALDAYKQRFHSGELIDDVDGARCGYLQLSEDEATLGHLEQVLGGSGAMARILNPQQASETLGLKVSQSAIDYPGAFWLNPPAVVQSLLTHPNIELQKGLGTVTLHREDERWWARSGSGESLDCAPLAVIACAMDSGTPLGIDWLPLQTIRGQTTHLPTNKSLAKLNRALCHKGYIAPARKGIHCIGASYGPNEALIDERVEEHGENLGKLLRAVPDLNPQDFADGLTGHVALRCNSSDYLPLVGAVPDAPAFELGYAALQHNSRQVIAECPPLQPGLYLLTALGSRGLTYAPLAAELIASQIFGDPPPLPRYLQRAITPARFLFRAIKRGTR